MRSSRGRDRLHPPDGGAASEWSGRRSAYDILEVRRGTPEVLCGQGTAPAAASIALTPRGPRARARHGTAGRRRSRHVRDLDVAASRLRDHAFAEVLAPAIAYAQNGLPLERAKPPRGSRRLFREHGRARRRCSFPTAEGRPDALFTNKRSRRPIANLKEAASAGGDRVAQIERRGEPGIAASSRKRSTVSTGNGNHGHQRQATSGLLTGEDMAGWRRPTRSRYLRLRGYTVFKTGPWGQGPVTFSSWLCSRGSISPGSIRWRRFRTLDRGMHEAGLCRPRGVLRRSGFSRSADGDAVVGGLQRRAPQAGHRQGFARAAARIHRGLRRRGEIAPRGRRRSGGRRRATVAPAPASRQSAAWARCAATPCISTSSTRPAI